MFKGVSKNMQKIADGWTRTNYRWLSKLGDTAHISGTRDTIFSADDSAGHGQNQEKEKTQTTELDIFLLKKNFSTAIKICY